MSAGEALAEQLLALLAALAALALSAAEELGELAVAVALGILRVLLHAQGVAQALLCEPQEVVVLVLRAGDLPRLGLCGHRGSPSVDGHPGSTRPEFCGSRVERAASDVELRSRDDLAVAVAVAGSASLGVEREDLEDHVGPGVGGAGEGAYLAIDDGLDGCDEQSCGGRLQEGARLADALILAHLDHGALSGQESVLER